MKIATVSERLREYMEMYNLRQIDMVIKCQPYCRKHGDKMTDGIFWHYYKGDRTPKDPTLKMFAESFNVSEAWLAGYDVPMQRTESGTISPDTAILLADLAYDEKMIRCIEKIKGLSAPSQLKVYGYVDGLFDAESNE